VSVGASGDQGWDVSTQTGFLACYDATFPLAYRCAARLTGGDAQRAEDLVQDVFVTLLRSVRAGHVSVIGPGWVLTCVRHRFVDSVRSRGREDDRIRLVTAVPHSRPDEPADWSPMLAGLSDRERAALVFRYVDDLSVADIAQLLGASVRATESLLQRAKHKARRSEARHA
jgi:RNA polymerase sigma-70 factor, ECF subfamily